MVIIIYLLKELLKDLCSGVIKLLSFQICLLYAIETVFVQKELIYNSNES